MVLKDIVRTIALTELCRLSSSSTVRAEYVQLYSGADAAESSEVERYLGNYMETAECKPLDYWKQHRVVFPTLARLAIDFLAVCASSVESERWFSKGGRVITKFRASLEKNSVQASICLQSWYPTSFCTNVICVD